LTRPNTSTSSIASISAVKARIDRPESPFYKGNRTLSKKR
jgi:hypothetical protein